MQAQTVRIASQAIRYIEENLQEKLDLNMVAGALHYSKYHLHRIFTKTVGLTLHDYAKRRQLTEAARLLVFSQKPILEIALMSGYESQQAFTDIFKAMYKVSPAQFRETKKFYPLQLTIRLREELANADFTKDSIRFATAADVDAWMALVNLVIDGYPCLDQDDYTANLYRYIVDQKALILRNKAALVQSGQTAAGELNAAKESGRYDMAIGAMGFSPGTGNIDFLAVHPQYRRCGIAKLFLAKLADELPAGKEITLTTYRAGDKADTGYREAYCHLGFAARELLVEYGYPVQRFVLLPGKAVSA